MDTEVFCQTLEKYYTRLTESSNSKLIRPLSILKMHFSNILATYDSFSFFKKNNIKKVTNIKNKNLRNTISSCETYNHICSQLQAIRQDLTVQQISNPFTISVYETNARIALQHNDWDQFNICQTRLMELYELLPSQNREEFISLRIIYNLTLRTTSFTRQNHFKSMSIKSLFRFLTNEQRQSIFLRKSQEIVYAIATKNFYLFFNIYKDYPSEYLILLIEPLVEHLRYDALNIILKTYVPSIDIFFVLHSLSINDLMTGKKWLVNCGCKLDGVQKNVLKRRTNLNNFNYLE